LRRRHLIAIVALAILSGACSDNAVRLRSGIESAATRLAAGRDFTEERVRYVPAVARDQGYWLIFFPERRVYASELIACGMPPEVADRIYHELSYVDVGLGAGLVVAQDGERLTFTSYYGKELVLVRDLIVEYRKGPCEIVMRKENETLYIEGVL
jgi:hypothetical protein